jgi:hypothetical protein
MFAPKVDTSAVSEDGTVVSGTSGPAAASQSNIVAKPFWPLGIPLAVDVYVASSENVGDVVDIAPSSDVILAHVRWDNFKWGDWDIQKTWMGDITLPPVRCASHLHL